MIAVSLNVGGGVRLIKPAKLCIAPKHYKHNKDGDMAPGVCGNGSVPLSHWGNVVTRIGTHTHTLFWKEKTPSYNRRNTVTSFALNLQWTLTTVPFVPKHFDVKLNLLF